MTDENQTQRLLDDDDDVITITKRPRQNSPSERHNDDSDVNDDNVDVNDNNDVNVNTDHNDNTSPQSYGEDSEDDREFDKKSMREMMLKEFFVRAFIAKGYPIASNIYNYEAINLLVSAEISSSCEAQWRISTSEQSLVEYLVEFYRTTRDSAEGKRRWFSTCVLKRGEVLMEASKEDVVFIVKDFWGIDIKI